MNGKLKKILGYVLSFGVAAVLLYFSFRGVKWADFVDGLRSCRIGFVIITMAAGVMAFWFRGVRWRQLILPLDNTISRLTAFNAMNIAFLSNLVFPRLGEFVRCGVITARSVANHRNDTPEGTSDDTSQESNPNVATYDKVLGTMVLERSWDLVTMILIAAALLVLRWKKFGGFFVDKMWKPISDSLSFSLWWLVIAITVVCVVAIVLIYYFRNRNKACRKICDVCKGIWQGFVVAFKMKDKWKFILNTVVIWIMYWLMAVCTMYAIPAISGLNAVDALFLMIAGSFGWLIPTPGGFGSFHLIVKLALFTIYGIPLATGIIFATLSHESQTVTMIVFGIFSWLYETTTRRSGKGKQAGKLRQ